MSVLCMSPAANCVRRLCPLSIPKVRSDPDRDSFFLYPMSVRLLSTLTRHQSSPNLVHLTDHDPWRWSCLETTTARCCRQTDRQTQPSAPSPKHPLPGAINNILFSSLLTSSISTPLLPPPPLPLIHSPDPGQNLLQRLAVAVAGLEPELLLRCV